MRRGTRPRSLLVLGAALLGLLTCVGLASAGTFDVSAHSSWDRTYNWTVDKTANPSTLTLAPGATADVAYTVTVTNTGSTDSNWSISDGFSAFNWSGRYATAESLTVDGTTLATLSSPCNGAPWLLDFALFCTWGPVPLPSGGQHEVVGRLTFDNGDTITQTGGNVGPFNVEDVPKAGQPTTTNSSVDVSDSYAGDLGTVSVNDMPPPPRAFTYTRTVGPYSTAQCGHNLVTNTATITSHDSHVFIGSADAPVDVTVDGPACHAKTFTIGPSSMEGHLRFAPNTWFNGGYSFKFKNSTHAATQFSITAKVAVPVTCPLGGGSGGTITIPLGTVVYNVPAGNTDWLPTGDQNSILSWMGAIRSPDLCGGKLMDNAGGVVFTATVFQNPATGSLVDFRFKYRNPAAKVKPDTNCTDATDPNRNRADVCGASWSATVTDP